MKKYSEKHLYPLIQKWLLKKDYYCGETQTTVDGKDHQWINIGLKQTRFDVLGVKSHGGDFHEELELLAVEVKLRDNVTIRDLNQALGYRRFVDRAYFAKPGDYSGEEIAQALRSRLGLLSIFPEGKPQVREVLAAGISEPEQGLKSNLLHQLWISRCICCHIHFFRYRYDSKVLDPNYVLIKKSPAIRMGRGKDMKIYVCGDCAPLLGYKKVPFGEKRFRWVKNTA